MVRRNEFGCTVETSGSGEMRRLVVLHRKWNVASGLLSVRCRTDRSELLTYVKHMFSSSGADWLHVLAGRYFSMSLYGTSTAEDTGQQSRLSAL